MATTTNYSWTTPDDTALVKDGAAAIRTLGSSADTTVKALNPGTTAGDIDYYTTSTAKARVGIGTAGQLLRVNSGATAPEWATIPTGGMTLISTTTLSGASVSLSAIPATYNHLQLVIRDLLPATDGATLQLRMNSDSAASRHRSVLWSVGSGNEDFGATFFAIGPTVDNAVTQNLSIINVYDYTNTVTWKYVTGQSFGIDQTTNTRFNFNMTHNFYNQTAAISSLDLFMSSGNLTSGSVLLYGVK